MRLLILLAAIVLGGCASISPRSADELANASADAVDEYRYQVPLPVGMAYRNTLEKARECWQQTAGWPFPSTWFVDADAFDPAIGYARISVRIKQVVGTTVTLSPVSPDSTLIVGRGIKMSGGHIASHRDLPHLEAWALRRPVDCKDKLIF